MRPTPSARKADQEATMTQDARSLFRADALDSLTSDEMALYVNALEAALAAAETARSDAERMSRALNTENNNLMKRAEEAEQERDRLQRVTRKVATGLAMVREFQFLEPVGYQDMRAGDEVPCGCRDDHEEGMVWCGFHGPEASVAAIADYLAEQALFDALTPTHESEAT